MSSLIKGKVWKFGDNISTDFMCPAISERGGLSEEEMALYCMYANRPDWSEKVRKGEIVVGGKNFGCGSSRAGAPLNLKRLGIGCVVAESFGRIFFRNSIEIALPVIQCKGVSEAFTEGDIAQIDVATGLVENLTTGTKLRTNPLPDIAIQMLEAGGVVAMLKKEYRGESQ